MIRAVGDNAFVDDENGGAALHDASGVVRRWDDARGVALLEDPPRLAIARQNRGIGAMGIELVDVATGETERRIELGFTRVVAFAPDGNALLAQRGDGLFLVDGNGSGARIEGAPAGDYGPAFFDERGSFALCVFRAHSGARPAAELMRIHAGNKRMSWVSTPSQSVLDVVVDVRVTRCAALCAAFAPDRPSANDVREVTVGNARNFEESTSIDFAVRGAHAWPVRVWADARVQRVAIGYDDGSISVYDVHTMKDGPSVLTRFHVGADVVGLRVDVDRSLVIDRGAERARVFDLEGTRVADVDAPIATCFCEGGAAFVVGGAAFVVDARGSMRRIEGPTNLVDVAPHRRGLIALDDEGRAHVLEIATESSS